MSSEEGSAMTIDEAQLEEVGSGPASVSEGWFVVNAGEAAWLRHDAFGGRWGGESSGRVVAERPGLEPRHFSETGVAIAVLEPGMPSGTRHGESGPDNSF